MPRRIHFTDEALQHYAIEYLEEHGRWPNKEQLRASIKAQTSLGAGGSQRLDDALREARNKHKPETHTLALRRLHALALLAGFEGGYPQAEEHLRGLERGQAVRTRRDARALYVLQRGAVPPSSAGREELLDRVHSPRARAFERAATASTSQPRGPGGPPNI